jgi:ADP-heptose:LPS heptosyltransferase
MPRENALTAVATRFLRIHFWFRLKRPFLAPQKLLIVQPCCLAELLQTTPLLAVLHEYFPEAQIDWLVTDAMRPALSGNPHLLRLQSAGEKDLHDMGWGNLLQLAAQLRRERYDTAMIPRGSSLLSWLAWQADIPQRVGLRVGGHGLGHTISVQPPLGHPTLMQLALIPALGLPPSRTTAGRKMGFYPSDLDRTAVTRRLVEEVEWLGDAPLVLLNPGGGTGPSDPHYWPLERFVLLGNHLVRHCGAKVVLVGAQADVPVVRDVAGMMATAVTNWTGQLSLGELGALCEVADLYVGNDVGASCVAVATECPTLVICGPTSPETSGPYAPQGRLVSLWHANNTPFSWANGVTIDEAIAASKQLLARE